MLTVGLHPDLASLRPVLEEAGFGVTGEAAAIRALSASHIAREEVPEVVDFVLDGGGLLVCGGEGPLLPALHLLTLPGRVTGEAAPPAGGDRVAIRDAGVVTGVGYVLLRVDAHCVALGAERGAGRVVFVGSESPEPELALHGLRWISRQIEDAQRLIEGEAAHS